MCVIVYMGDVGPAEPAMCMDDGWITSILYFFSYPPEPSTES